MTTTPRPAWESDLVRIAGHAGHYALDAFSAVGQSPAAFHAFISAFTAHPDHPGTATRPGSVAAVVIILAVIATLAGWVRARVSKSP